MNTFLIIVLILITVFLGYNLWLFIRTRRSVGKKILLDNIQSEIKTEIDNKKGILYFYSAKCSNCKVQLNILNNMDLEDNQLIEINIHEDPDTARIFKVMGTPTLVFFANNNIVGYFIGVKSEKFISSNINNLL